MRRSSTEARKTCSKYCETSPTKSGSVRGSEMPIFSATPRASRGTLVMFVGDVPNGMVQMGEELPLRVVNSTMRALGETETEA